MLTGAVREEYEARIAATVADVVGSAPNGWVFCYLSVGAEVGTEQIIKACRALGRRICVPKVLNKEMIAVAYDEGCEVAVGAFGAIEPQNTPAVRPEDIGIVLAPMVGFDHRGNRLGQGGGYYDKFLRSQAFAVGVAFSCQEASFPTEPHDVPMDALVTECGARVFNESYRRKIQG